MPSGCFDPVAVLDCLMTLAVPEDMLDAAARQLASVPFVPEADVFSLLRSARVPSTSAISVKQLLKVCVCVPVGHDCVPLVAAFFVHHLG